MKAKLSLLAALTVCLLFLSSGALANNLLNGSFQNNNFSFWTTGGNFTFTQVVSGPFYVYSGGQDADGFYATLGPIGPDGTLSQTFATTPGTQYMFSFWLASVGDDPSDFSAYWDGSPVLSLTDPNTGVSWTQFSFCLTGTGLDTIAFSFADDPAYIALDNVSVTPCSPVPEPTTLATLFGFGMFNLAVVLGVRRRKPI